MGAAFFYHLTAAPLEATLPMLIAKSRERDWQIEVRGVDVDRMAALDTALWRGHADSFEPHGLAGGRHDADQPVLLTSGNGAANAPTCLMAVHGADVTPEEVVAMERTCILFDGHDEAALAQARSQWKTLTDAGCSAQYWSQDGGRWEKKAEK